MSCQKQLLVQFLSPLQDSHNHTCMPRALQHPEVQSSQEDLLVSQVSYDMMKSSKLSGRQQSLRQPWCKGQHSCKDQLLLLDEQEQAPQRSARIQADRAQMTTG